MVEHDVDGFDGYVETSVDPGPFVLIATIVLSAFMLAILPVFVGARRKYQKRLNQKNALETNAHENALSGNSSPRDREVRYGQMKLNESFDLLCYQFLIFFLLSETRGTL